MWFILFYINAIFASVSVDYNEYGYATFFLMVATMCLSKEIINDLKRQPK